MGDHDVNQHAYKRIIGARLDAVTGQVHVVVAWQDNTQNPTCGSWEPIEDIGNIPTGESVAEDTDQCGQQQQHFGKQLVAGTMAGA